MLNLLILKYKNVNEKLLTASYFIPLFFRIRKFEICWTLLFTNGNFVFMLWESKIICLLEIIFGYIWVDFTNNSHYCEMYRFC